MFAKARATWNDLSPRARRFIAVAATVDGALKAAALNDLARRSPSEVRGNKLAWGAALTLVNSLGALPLIYFAKGRQGSDDTH